ncbi:MAG: methionine-R-sulfoxide reductase [Sulfurovum sp.]|nr:methionine-R-sulfoxide reductase [Sulfurovum sp.]
MAYKTLSEEETSIIINKGTERAFTGEYWNHYEDGTYNCRQCNTELFDSNTKFDSFTGWPSFDNTIDGAVKEIVDADGIRIEIVCNTCNGHLGHVFKDEGISENNERHCVNSVSLTFAEKV